MGRIEKFTFLLLASLIFSVAADDLPIKGGKFSVAWQSDFNRAEKEKILAWLLYAANSASLINGQFPRLHTQIQVKRHSRSNQPVPWAHTIRNTSPEGVSFHVNPTVSLDKFNRDWTAVHEFSHLYLPYVGSTDIWISEGFASYYQNILMARAGTLTEHRMWQKLADGFSRGTNDLNQSITLGKLSAEMRRNRAFRRVYWSGALYFLEMDIALHLIGQSLDAVVSEFNNCCRSQHRHWNGIKLAQAFDQVARTTLFTSKYKAYEADMSFRDYLPVLSQLGLILNGKEINFLEDQQGAELRKGLISSIETGG